jgi:GT2 family glycosyltransferase
MNYPQILEKSSLLKETCFEHIFRFLKHDEFLGRLVTERSLFSDTLSNLQNNRSIVSLFILITHPPDEMLEKTLHSWELQSCPWVKCRLIPTSPENMQALECWMSARPGIKGVNLSVEIGDDFHWDFCQSEYAVFARSGDVFHPSLATALALLKAGENPDMVVFNYQHVSNDGKTPLRFFRRPELELHSLLHVNYIGTGFAVKLDFVNQYPHDIVDHILRNEGHLFHLWMSGQREVKWISHPEYFVLRPQQNIPENARALYTPFAEMYREMILTAVDGFDWVELEGQDQPYGLAPARKPASTSVIILFRDKPEETRNCLQSLLAQQISSYLEIILVNNQSSEQSIALISEFIRELKKFAGQNITAKLINYNHPFNHSRQCNRAIEQSSGEVIVLLNNDALLKSSKALETLGGWAIAPGIGSVGGRIESSEGKLVSAGIRARLNAGFDYNSGVEESVDTNYSVNIRETFGNSFACTAFSRKVYNELGPFNETEFPNGYNDVEYCLRLRRSGYRNIYLGHIAIEHQPGTSRGRSDEIQQKILIRKRYPELAKAGLFQLGSDKHLMERWKKINSNFSKIKKAVIP